MDIYSSFAVPQYYDKEAKALVIDLVYLQKMMKFHRKVNPKEGLVGMYITSKKLGEHESILIKYFSDQFASDKKKALLPQPLIMMVDPSL